MALIEEPKKHPIPQLLWIGIPTFLFATVVSVGSHLAAHTVAGKFFPPPALMHTSLGGALDAAPMIDPVTALLGLVWTFLLSIASFAFFLHHPRSLFATSLAFVNTTLRLPEMVSVFVQYLLYHRTTLGVDESYSLYLLQLTNPMVAVLLLCFFSLSMLFLTVIIIHDTKTIPWKWLVAGICFVAVTLLKNWMVSLFGYPAL